MKQLVITLLTVAGLSASAAQSPTRSIENFDRDWRFARFGLQPDGSRKPEPGKQAGAGKAERQDDGHEEPTMPHRSFLLF